MNTSINTWLRINHPELLDDRDFVSDLEHFILNDFMLDAYSHKALINFRQEEIVENVKKCAKCKDIKDLDKREYYWENRGKEIQQKEKNLNHIIKNAKRMARNWKQLRLKNK